MKTKRVKKQSVHIALIASIVMCFLFISKGYSSIFEITPIETKGTWNNSNEDNKIERSLPTIPISAYLSGNFIMAEKMKDCLEDFASVQERRAYIQGYADCVQVLFHMGLLRKTEGLKWPEKME